MVALLWVLLSTCRGLTVLSLLSSSCRGRCQSIRFSLPCIPCGPLRLQLQSAESGSCSRQISADSLQKCQNNVPWSTSTAFCTRQASQKCLFAEDFKSFSRWGHVENALLVIILSTATYHNPDETKKGK
eukprot:5404201-Amphidinium_carterae.1